MNQYTHSIDFKEAQKKCKFLIPSPRRTLACLAKRFSPITFWPIL